MDLPRPASAPASGPVASAPAASATTREKGDDASARFGSVLGQAVAARGAPRGDPLVEAMGNWRDLPVGDAAAADAADAAGLQASEEPVADAPSDGLVACDRAEADAALAGLAAAQPASAPEAEASDVRPVTALAIQDALASLAPPPTPAETAPVLTTAPASVAEAPMPGASVTPIPARVAPVPMAPGFVADGLEAADLEQIGAAPAGPASPAPVPSGPVPAGLDSAGSLLPGQAFRGPASLGAEPIIGVAPPGLAPEAPTLTPASPLSQLPTDGQGATASAMPGGTPDSGVAAAAPAGPPSAHLGGAIQAALAPSSGMDPQAALTSAVTGPPPLGAVVIAPPATPTLPAASPAVPGASPDASPVLPEGATVVQGGDPAIAEAKVTGAPPAGQAGVPAPSAGTGPRGAAAPEVPPAATIAAARPAEPARLAAPVVWEAKARPEDTGPPLPGGGAEGLATDAAPALPAPHPAYGAAGLAEVPPPVHDPAIQDIAAAVLVPVREGEAPVAERRVDPQPSAPPAAQPGTTDPVPRTPPVISRAATATPVAWPARQVAPFAVALALGADSSLTLTLDPAELGRVEVSIDRSRGEAMVRVTAERADTLALLQRDAQDLERALSDAGLGERGTSLSFSLGDGSAARDQAREQAQPNAQGAPAPRSAAQAARDTALPALGAIHRQGAVHRGLLDLAV